MPETAAVRIEIGFQGGDVLSMRVPVEDADALDQALRARDDTVCELRARGRRVPRRARTRAVRQAVRARGARRLRLFVGPVGLEVGIVGLPRSGKTTLFNALTRAGASVHDAKEHVGMAQIADARLDAVARVEGSAKVTPATIRVQDVPGTGAALLGNLRRVDALLCAVDGFSAGADPARDLEQLELELLVADRDHVEARLERVRTQAKSGDPRLRTEADGARGVARASRRGRRLRRLRGRGAGGARAADDEAASRRRERAGRHRSRTRARAGGAARGGGGSLPRRAVGSRGGRAAAAATRSTSSRSSQAATRRRERGRCGVARRRSRRRPRSTPTSRAASFAAR